MPLVFDQCFGPNCCFRCPNVESFENFERKLFPPTSGAADTIRSSFVGFLCIVPRIGLFTESWLSVALARGSYWSRSPASLLSSSELRSSSSPPSRELEFRSLSSSSSSTAVFAFCLWAAVEGLRRANSRLLSSTWKSGSSKSAAKRGSLRRLAFSGESSDSISPSTSPSMAASSSMILAFFRSFFFCSNFLERSSSFLTRSARALFIFGMLASLRARIRVSASLSIFSLSNFSRCSS